MIGLFWKHFDIFRWALLGFTFLVYAFAQFKLNAYFIERLEIQGQAIKDLFGHVEKLAEYQAGSMKREVERNAVEIDRLKKELKA